MTALRALCVYCASSQRCAPRFRETAARLGRAAAERGVEIVYGGGHIGLMGAVADAALGAGGKVTGIIPDFLMARELGHSRLTELVVVQSMHERKREMFERADAFAILPGGLGTLEETFEILTWRQLGLHDKPIVLLNTAGYWDHFVHLLEHQVNEGFVKPANLALFQVADSVEDVLPALKRQPAEHVDIRSKWT